MRETGESKTLRMLSQCAIVSRLSSDWWRVEVVGLSLVGVVSLSVVSCRVEVCTSAMWDGKVTKNDEKVAMSVGWII